MAAHFPVPPELQPGFALYSASALFLGGATFVSLSLLEFVYQRKKALGAIYLTNWIKELWELFVARMAFFEKSSATYTDQHQKHLDSLILSISVMACLSLSLIEYYGGSSGYSSMESLLKYLHIDVGTFFKRFSEGPRAKLYRLGYWSGFITLVYFCLPCLFLKSFFKIRIRDYGLSFRGLLEHSWIYVALFLIVFPFVVAVSTTNAFRNAYPFYGNAYLSAFDFFAWECIYAVQFFALEFFFRGLLIHGLKKRFGFYAILFSVVPYCMIHFGKPFPETIGAIIAGLALGILSLFSNSIWLGVLIHISVAISMDFLSLAGQGLF